MWYAFFVFGGFWFWTLLAIELIVLSAFVQDENPLGSFLCVLIFVALIHLFGDVNLFTWLKDHPWDFVRILILYAAIGFGWGCVKFYYVSQRIANKIKNIKQEFTENFKSISKDYQRNHSNSNTDSATIWDWYMRHELSHEEQRKLSFFHQGTKIIFWMSYWPISMFWTMFTDILKNAFTWAYETFLVNIFKSIHTRTIGKAAAFDMEIPKTD